MAMERRAFQTNRFDLNALFKSNTNEWSDPNTDRRCLSRDDRSVCLAWSKVLNSARGNLSSQLLACVRSYFPPYSDLIFYSTLFTRKCLSQFMMENIFLVNCLTLIIWFPTTMPLISLHPPSLRSSHFYFKSEYLSINPKEASKIIRLKTMCFTRNVCVRAARRPLSGF